MRARPTPDLAQGDLRQRHVSIRRLLHSPAWHGRLLAAVLSALALAALALGAAGCGSSSSTSTSTPSSSGTTATAATTTSSAATATTVSTSTAAPAASGLSGTWSGEYSGGYHGTFTITWQQSGSSLSGTIKLSTPASTLSIHGSLAGSTIRFGTVGSLAITYSGSVSGSSMSGSYQVAGSGGGSWSANKTS